MPPAGSTTLAALWRDWAARVAALDDRALRVPTRCDGWTVHDLVAHVAPSSSVLAGLGTTALADPAAVTDAADLLRRFNAPGGAAHAMAPVVAEQARTSAATQTREVLAASFTASATVIEGMSLDPDVALPYPVVGSVTAAVLVDVSLLEGVAHLLDLVAAVGGPPPAADALAHVAAVLVRVTGAAAFVEAATGRVPCDGVLPAVR